MTRRRLMLGLAVSAVVLLALNVTGLLRYPGGPLRDPTADGILWLDTRPADQGSTDVAVTSLAGVLPRTPLYTGISLRNKSQSAVTVEQIRLLNATPGLRLVDARMSLPGTSGPIAAAVAGSGPNVDELRLDTDYGLLPANLAPDSESGEGRVSIEVTADSPGEFTYDAVAVDYRVGPFAFTVVLHNGFGVCFVPMPAGTCSLD